jgi:ElaB/YqjD/DUF883 family membrane-anchored ribosome-binding protein
MRTKTIDPNNIDINFLKDEFNRFRAEMAGMKDKIGVNAADALDQMSTYLNGSNISSRLANLEQELEVLGARLKGTGKDAVVKLETKVSERPIASIAIAFGVGLLASQLIRRS